MLDLPKIIQPLLTYITGKAIFNSSDNIIKNPIYLFIINIMYLILLSYLSIYIIDANFNIWYIFLPIILIKITGILRLIHVVFGHYCIHNAFFHKKNLNKIMLEICTIIPIVQNANTYKNDHLNHHSKIIFATEKDADAIFVKELGFKKGMKKQELWFLFIKTLLSPLFHIKMFIIRIKSSLSCKSIFWKIISVTWIMIVLLYPAYSNLSNLYILWIPIFILYNISMLMQFITEHGWFGNKSLTYDELSWGRFCGSRYYKSSNYSKKLSWWLIMIFYHLPIRVGCLVGDLPVHDWHHFASPSESNKKWMNAVIERGKISKNKENNYIELWGLHNMLNHVFSIIENKRKQMINNKMVLRPFILDSIINETNKLGFNMTSENDVGVLLKTLAATKNNNCSFLELGTGTGISTAWILEGMSKDSTLITMDNDQTLLDIANKYLSSDKRLKIVCQDGDDFVNRIYKENKKFDFIFADTWSGKYQLLEKTLEMLRTGGLYIIDDMIEQENWPEGHELKVNTLLDTLNNRKDLAVLNLDWSCGILICTKLEKKDSL